MHEALLWMGYATDAEAERSGWTPWLDELRAAGRAVAVPDERGMRWFAAEALRDPEGVLRGRLEALGPVRVVSDDASAPASEEMLTTLTATEAEPLLALEAQGVILRCRIAGTQAWCERRLLARIHRYTLDRLRREIEPVTAHDFWHYLTCWQHADPSFRLEGPRGAQEVVRKLAGFEAPAIEWESSILRVRLHDPRPDWLDQLTDRK